jgi:hypothetical protein
MSEKSVNAHKWTRKPKKKVFKVRPRFIEARRIFLKKVVEVVVESDYEFETKQ